MIRPELTVKMGYEMKVGKKKKEEYMDDTGCRVL
jgi:hypothetical protein